jgi:hypothetical protein
VQKGIITLLASTWCSWFRSQDLWLQDALGSVVLPSCVVVSGVYDIVHVRLYSRCELVSSEGDDKPAFPLLCIRVSAPVHQLSDYNETVYAISAP